MGSPIGALSFGCLIAADASAESWTGDESECPCSRHSLDLGVHSQAAKRRLQIPTNRMWAKEEALGDERNGGSSGKQPQDFCLARRELAYARAFGSGSAVGS